MKRSYSDLKTSLLPVISTSDARHFKSTLEGSYELRVFKAIDISKPTAKPVDEIDEPENQEEARENKLNQNNARMIKLSLRDTNGTEISAIETERINELDSVQAGWKVFIEGPIDIRCGNMMLEKKHVIGKEKLSDTEAHALLGSQFAAPAHVSMSAPRETVDSEATQIVYVDVEQIPIQSGQSAGSGRQPPPTVPADWDEEDEDDCIVID